MSATLVQCDACGAPTQPNQPCPQCGLLTACIVDATDRASTQPTRWRWADDGSYEVFGPKN